MFQMKGVEFLRKLHANAGFSIRPQARNGKVDLLKEMVESIVASRDEVREALQSLVQPQDPCYTTSAKGRANTATDKFVRGQDQQPSQEQPSRGKAGRFTRVNWWARPDSNRGPSGVSLAICYEPAALSVFTVVKQPG